MPIPEAIRQELKAQIDVVAKLHDQDLAAGDDGAFLEDDIEKKYPKAPSRRVPSIFDISPRIPPRDGRGAGDYIDLLADRDGAISIAEAWRAAVNLPPCGGGFSTIVAGVRIRGG